MESRHDSTNHPGRRGQRLARHWQFGIGNHAPRRLARLAVHAGITTGNDAVDPTRDAFHTTCSARTPPNITVSPARESNNPARAGNKSTGSTPDFGQCLR